MSHNITAKIRCSMSDLESEVCQEMFRELGWVFMKGGTYTGYRGQGNAAVQADVRIAVPADQAGSYGEDLSPEDAKTYGLKGGYKVIALKRGKAEPAIGKNGKPEVGPDGKPKVHEAIEITADDYQLPKIQQKINAIIAGAKTVHKIQRQIGVLKAGGNEVNVNIFQIKKQIANSIKTMAPVKISNQF